MLAKLFGFILRLGKKYKLHNTWIGLKITPFYHKIQRITTNQVIVNPNDKTILSIAQQNDFLAQNIERVNIVANMLADEKSQKTYLSMVKFRQTCQKKDFPISYYEKVEYFIKELKLDNDEVFIDCGAYTGDTIDEFLKHCPEYKQIVAFEPASKIFKKLKEKYENNPKIILKNAGAYDKNGVVDFIDANAGETGTIIAGGGEYEDLTSIQVNAIDNLNLEKVTFIKMDIEGAELNALKGAEKTILRDKPKLAICIYHSNEDMVCIAEYIHNLVPEYKLYVRQHSLYPSAVGTVLYAIMP